MKSFKHLTCLALATSTWGLRDKGAVDLDIDLVPGHGENHGDKQLKLRRSLILDSEVSSFQKRTYLNQSAEELVRQPKTAIGRPGMGNPDSLRKAILDTSKWLTEEGIEHFFIDGTLLGLVRDGGLIPGDSDVDVAVNGKDLNKVRKLYADKGFTLDNYLLPPDNQVIVNVKGKAWPGGTADIYGYSRGLSENDLCFHESMHYRKKNIVFPLKKIKIASMASESGDGPKDAYFSIPNDAEGFLLQQYGSGWRTPKLDARLGNANADESMKHWLDRKGVGESAVALRNYARKCADREEKQLLKNCARDIQACAEPYAKMGDVVKKEVKKEVEELLRSATGKLLS